MASSRRRGAELFKIEIEPLPELDDVLVNVRRRLTNAGRDLGERAAGKPALEDEEIFPGKACQHRLEIDRESRSRQCLVFSTLASQG